MAQYPILATKLYIPPVRPELVSRPRLIERLNAGLPTRDAFTRALTLVSAPAGFGKTTLVSEWVHTVGAHRDAPQVAWLSLDEGDNDPARFLAYVIAALQTLALRETEGLALNGGVSPGVEGIEAIFGEGALNMLQSSGVAGATTPLLAQAVLTSLINEIAAIPDRIVLVLDDYHLIEAQAIHDALTFLLDHLPPPPGGGMHLVIATREDPPLPFARLRARGQLTELRASDLRFSSSEAAEFLDRVMGLDLSAEDIAALEARTEGWIAGLHLAAVSMQGHKDATNFIRSFTGSHRFVLDYLVEEVLEQQSESVQTFLLQTSVLDRLTGSLCDAVRVGYTDTPSTARADAVRLDYVESHNGQATLEMLERANLFIVPLDEERRWYRYHHLFADLLRQRLRRTQPEQVSTLHARASEWYEQNGFIDEAIEHALRGEDFERAADLIETSVDALWQRGEHAKLQRWLAGLPVELVFSKPYLCIIHAWGLFVSGQHGAAESSLQAAEKALGPGPDEAGPEAETEASPLEQDQRPDSKLIEIQGRVAAFRAFMATYHGDIPGMLKYSRQALEALPEQELPWRIIASIALADAHLYEGEYTAAYRARLATLEASRETGNAYLIITSSLRLATILREQGRLQQVIEICHQQLLLANESGLSQSGSVGWLLAIWGEVLAEMNDLDEALDKTGKGVEFAERGGDVAILGLSNLCLVRVLFSRGDIAGAAMLIQKMEDIARQYAVPPWMTSEMAAWQGRIWLAQDKLSAASKWVLERELDVDREPTYLNEFEYRVLTRIRIAQGQLEDASMLLKRLLEVAEAGEHTSRVIEILMLQALAFQAGDDTARAMTTLERALTLADPGGFIRIFVDEGPPMAQLLHTASARGMMPGYTAKLLAAFDDAPKSQKPALSPPKGRTTQLRPSSTLVEPLSEREIEVLQLVAEGLTNREIASRLFVSLNTVKAHTRNIYGKLGVRNRTEAVARARALGVLPLI